MCKTVNFSNIYFIWLYCFALHFVYRHGILVCKVVLAIERSAV